jgi:hypothetical protein
MAAPMAVDATVQLATEVGAFVISHVHTQGYDQALNSGFAASYANVCNFFVTLDVDGQHDAKLLPHILRLLEDAADIVIGVRSRHARLAEHIFACVTRLRYGIRDPLCGLKAYRASVYAARGHFDSYNSIGTELALFAAAGGLRLDVFSHQVIQ